MLKITLIICQKSQKKLDHNAQFELKIAQVYVFQGKKNQNHTYLRSKKSKKYSIIRRKNTEIYQKKLFKTHLLSALKFEKVADNKA